MGKIDDSESKGALSQTDVGSLQSGLTKYHKVSSPYSSITEVTSHKENMFSVVVLGQRYQIEDMRLAG